MNIQRRWSDKITREENSQGNVTLLNFPLNFLTESRGGSRNLCKGALLSPFPLPLPLLLPFSPLPLLSPPFPSPPLLSCPLLSLPLLSSPLPSSPLPSHPIPFPPFPSP